MAVSARTGFLGYAYLANLDLAQALEPHRAVSPRAARRGAAHVGERLCGHGVGLAQRAPDLHADAAAPTRVQGGNIEGGADRCEGEDGEAPRRDQECPERANEHDLSRAAEKALCNSNPKLFRVSPNCFGLPLSKLSNTGVL